MVTRVVEVPGERLAGWVERYAATHPGTRVSWADPSGVRLDTDAGASAAFAALLPFAPAGTVPPDGLVAALAHHAGLPVVTALILIRRGGFAVGLARGAALERSKVGSRYVQSRTAAGGWSQQRFARRREGQAKELVRTAAEAWSQLGSASSSTPWVDPTVLVTGGDRALCDAVLDEPAVRGLRALGVARHLDLPDPRLTVLEQAAARAQALLVTIREP
jgi:hypothetical protein